MASRKQLVERWTTPEFEPVARQVAEAILTGAPLSDVAPRTDEGRVDLRGYQFPVPHGEPWGVWDDELVEQLDGFIELNDTALHGIDFSHASMPHWRAMNAELVDCRFDAAHCEDWRLWQTDVTRCTFTRTTLAASMLGCTHEGRPDTWSHCTFVRTDLRDCDLSDSDVHDCEFTDARIERFTAFHTTWERCTFTGRLRTVRFSGLPHPPGADMSRLADAWWMDEVDFSACTFHDVVLDDYHLDTVSLPVGTVVFPAGPATWAAAAAHLRRQPDSPGLETALSMADYFAGRPGCAGDGQSIYSPLGIPADGPLVDALLRAGAHVVPPPR